MDRSPRQSRLPRTVVPVLALALLSLTACTNSQESSTVKGTVPPVWTGAPAPPSGEFGKQHGNATADPGARIDLTDPAGRSVGTATVVDTGEYLKVTVEGRGLPPGQHGLHFHEVGACDPGTGYLSAGEQLGGAAGDLSALQILQDGMGTLVTNTDTVTLTELKGKSLVLHTGPDSLPGDGGGRIACGVIQ